MGKERKWRTFFRESESRNDELDGAINGESNNGLQKQDMGYVSTRYYKELFPWKIVSQNIQRIVTKNSKEKVQFLEDYVKEEKILILNFTETWLNKTIQDDPEIAGYKLHRGDRSVRIGGGTAIYVREDCESEKIAELSTDSVEMVAVHIEKLNLINIVIYRPPDASTHNFKAILKSVIGILKDVVAPEPTVIITGDFNFPFLKWKRCLNGGCIWEEKKEVGATKEAKLQFEFLDKEMDNFGLVQIIEEPTRNKNTLDLVYTNEVSLFTEVEVMKSNLSDHDRIELNTNIMIHKNLMNKNENLAKETENCIHNLNFNEKSIEWEKIKKELEVINWLEIFNDKDTESCLERITYMCKKYIPIKKCNNRCKIPKKRKRLFNKIKMLRRSKSKANKRKKDVIDRKIIEVEKEILNDKREERNYMEKKVIDNINQKPKLFFGLIKNKEKRNNKIGPFKNEGEYVTDNKEICNTMVKQYNAQFSKNNNAKVLMDDLFDNLKDDDLSDICISEDDIQKAIGEMNPNSSAGPDGIPATFLTKTKTKIALPLKLILRKSIDEGKIPDGLKLAYITPIHKGGSRQKPENYRPVSLTSHIMKIFERVVKVRLIEHLKQHNLINQGQHGFVPGRSTQTQLLDHFCRVYEAIEDNARLDTVYLDFAKAFDKVDHNLLLTKLAEHKVKGKLWRWIKMFLTNRKYRVVANGEMSEEQKVLSGVPQGTVLAAILFIIMISDIDEEIKRCIVRCFADDTRINIKVRTEEDKEAMQEDLNKIYIWAECNIMKFNERKFEQMSWGEAKGVDIESYKTATGLDIERKEKVKDLGVVTSENLQFKEHIDSIVTACKIKQGNILRNFSTRKEAPMMKLYKAHIRSKAEYCCVVWSPTTRQEISKLERIQKSFTKRIEGMEDKDYHQRLNSLKLYSLERRRERYMILNTWQQIEGQRENIMGFKMNERSRHREIKSTRIKFNRNVKNSSVLHNCPALKMMRLFNALPGELRDITGVTFETFKKKIDKWLSLVPDTPIIDNYKAAAESNSILHQAAHRERNFIIT